MLLVCHAACLHFDIMGTCLPHGEALLGDQDEALWSHEAG